MTEIIELIETNVSLECSLELKRYAEDVNTFLSKHPPGSAS